MTTLDDPRSMVDPSTVSVWPTALRYGGIVSLILIVIGLVMHLAGLSDPANPSTVSQAVNCLNYIAIIAAVIMAIKAHRDKELGGFITLRRSIGVGTATSLVIGAITAVWMIIFMTVVDPGMSEAIKDAAMQNAQPGQEEVVEQMVGIFSNPFILSAVALFGTVIIGLVTALIGGAIMRKDPMPNV
jgi:hypothetical protein